MAKVYSKLCPTLSGHLLRWLDDSQFIASVIGRDGQEKEMICNKQYWEVSTV